MVVDYGISVVQASKVTGVARSTIAYKPKPKDDSVWIELLGALVERHPGIGFDKAYHRIRHKGSVVNKKKLYRIYTAMGLNIRRRKRKRLPARVKQALFVPDGPNKVWSMDFMHDSLWNGKPFRVLNVVYDYNRQALWIEPDTSLPAERVVRVLNQLKESRGVPAMIRVDNGPELVSIKLDLWCRENGVTLAFIQPGKPTQNAFIERFNRTLRTEVLNAYVFRTTREVREHMDMFRLDYNHHRPHEGLGNRTPIQHQTITQTSSLQLTDF